MHTFVIFGQFFFTRSDTELDYYQQKVNVQANCLTSCQTTEDLDLRKLGNFKKNSKVLGFDCEYPADHSKGKFGHLGPKNLEKPPGKDSTEKHILLNFVRLSTIPCLLYLRKYTSSWTYNPCRFSGASLKNFWKVAHGLQKCRPPCPPWLVGDDEHFGLRNSWKGTFRTFFNEISHTLNCLFCRITVNSTLSLDWDMSRTT